MLKRLPGVVRSTVRWNSFKAVSRPDGSKLKSPRASGETTSVASQLSVLMKSGGPLTVAEYMKRALTGAVGGYYMHRDAIGARGDFVTSPELSQIFGEVVAVWLVAEWRKLSMPTPFQLVELGPGRGTLTAHILKYIQKLGIESKDYTVHLVEVSPFLQRYQADRLCLTHKESDSNEHYHEGENIQGSKTYWHKDFSTIPKGFKLLIAHEFFDALPIHKLTRTDKGWREILIDVDPSNNTSDPKFRFVLSPNETVATKLYSNLLKESKHDHFEICPQALVLADQISTQIDENGGIALIIDYGDEGFMGDTFRAYKNHKQVDPLIDVGNADLTADVNFKLLKEAAKCGKVFGPVSQRDFLLSSHAEVRLKVLLEKADEEHKKILESSFNMLIDKDKMGDRFKFMAIFPTINERHYENYPVWGFS